MSDFAGNTTVDSGGNPSLAEPIESSSVTSTNGGEAKQSATVQDNFIPEGVDINTLPPNVRTMIDKINKDMVRGFTEKTSKMSETIKSEIAKATEGYQQKATFYDQISQQEEFVKQWNDYVQKSQAAVNDPMGTVDPALAKVEAKLQEMSQKIQFSEVTQITEAFADAVDEKGVKIHGDFDRLNGIPLGKVDGNGEEYSLLRACIELSGGKNPQERLANGYKTAKAVADQIFEEGKKAGMGRLQTKVLNGSQPPSNSSSEGLSMTDKKPKNAREAMEMARKGLMVSRD